MALTSLTDAEADPATPATMAASSTCSSVMGRWPSTGPRPDSSRCGSTLGSVVGQSLRGLSRFSTASWNVAANVSRAVSGCAEGANSACSVLGMELCS
jgi:hypothetical protein